MQTDSLEWNCYGIVGSHQNKTEHMRFHRSAADAFVRGLGKETVIVKDSLGFIVNCLVLPMLNEAACLVFEGEKTTVENVDRAVTL